MTQPIDQRARELLAKHWKAKTTLPESAYPDLCADSFYVHHSDVIAALTEALTRIEELEAELARYIELSKTQDDFAQMALRDHLAAKARIEELEGALKEIARLGVDMRSDFSRSADQSRIARQALGGENV